MQHYDSTMIAVAMFSTILKQAKSKPCFLQSVSDYCATKQYWSRAHDNENYKIKLNPKSENSIKENQFIEVKNQFFLRFIATDGVSLKESDFMFKVFSKNVLRCRNLRCCRRNAVELNKERHGGVR